MALFLLLIHYGENSVNDYLLCYFRFVRIYQSWDKVMAAIWDRVIIMGGGNEFDIIKRNRRESFNLKNRNEAFLFEKPRINCFWTSLQRTTIKARFSVGAQPNSSNLYSNACSFEIQDITGDKNAKIIAIFSCNGSQWAFWKHIHTVENQCRVEKWKWENVSIDSEGVENNSEYLEKAQSSELQSQRVTRKYSGDKGDDWSLRTGGDLSRQKRDAIEKKT